MTDYHGDINPAETIDWTFFTTVNGVPTDLAGSPAASVYKGSNNAESTAGVTLTVPADSRTGMARIVVDTSADGSFYATANNFNVVITTGTLGGISQIGGCIGSFSIQNRSPLRPTTANRTLDVTATGEAGLDWSNMSGQTAAQNLSATQIQSVNNLASGTDSINTVATSGSTLTTGSSVSGTYASTAALDGVYWQISDTAGTLDMYFQFDVGTYGVPTTAVWTGGLTTVVNVLKVYAYNWGATAWEQVGTINGTTSLIVNNAQFDFTTSHVGTGGNLGLVRLRFQNAGLTSANFYTDQVLCGYTNVFTTTQLATAVWQDTTAGDFTVAASIGKSIMNGVALGTGLTIVSVSGSVGSVSGAVGSVSGNVGGNVTGSVGSVVGLTASNLDTTVSSRLAPTVAGRTLDVTITGAAGVDWGNLENPTTVNGLTNTTISSSQIVASVAGAVGSVTGLNAALLDAAVSTRATPAQVNVEVVDALATDTYVEPGQEVPAATAPLTTKIGFLYKAWRNKSDQTDLLYNLYSDDGVTVDQKAGVSDDGVTFIRDEITSGP